MSFRPYRTPADPAPVRRRRWRWALLRWGVILMIWGVLAGGAVLIWFARDLPRPETALDASRRPGLSLEDRSGRVLATYGDIVGEPLQLSTMASCLPEAAVAVEDRRFYHHFGFDPVGIMRAMEVNLRAGRLVQGGSTITQQVAKTLFLTNARTFRRKVQELMLTVWLERSFSKREILEIYLNRVYLGSGAWGVDAAARLYFGLSARKLELWQCAVLAGLPRAPSRFNPRADPAAAAARGREVLAAMAETGAVTPAQAQAAEAAIAFAPSLAGGGWFADWAAEASQAVLPQDADAVVRTTLDPRLQAVAQGRLTALLDGPGAAASVGEGAVVVMDAASGAVRALVGGREYRSGAFDRAVAARRQPGSAFKPFIWLAALEHGMKPGDRVQDAPLRIGGWSPQNFDGTYRGDVSLEDALAQSLNTVSVRLLQSSGGPHAAIEVARRLGIADKLPGDLSLALGTGEVGLLEMAGAYAALLNGGYAVLPYGIERATVDRAPFPIARPAPSRVIQADDSNAMVRMLGAVVARGSGRAAAVPGRFVAGKTGTTQDYRDAWFIGIAGTTVIGVWLGNDDNRPMKDVTGSSLPARLFHEIALSLHE